MPSNKQVPIVGEPFKDYVNSQIKVRQDIHGSGLNGHRSVQEISYLNSRTSWIKMASSVEVIESAFGKKRLKQLGLNNYPAGINLAQEAVLFNTVGSNNTRSGVSTTNSLINNKAYGFGGTEFGIQPPPGILDFSVTHENRGSIRTATINLKANNKFQFELIEILYLRLGYTMMIEWGDSTYFNNNKNYTIATDSLINEYWFKNSGATQLEVLEKIESKRSSTNGNYDALFGKVVNFDWEFDTDGSYSISIQLASLGDVVESFKISALPLSAQISEASTQKSDEEPYTEEELNQNILSNYFHCLRGTSNKDEFFNLTDVNNPYYQNLIYISSGEIDRNTKVNETKGILPKDKYYIRLRHLLHYFYDQSLVYFKSKGGKCYPIFDIDLSEESIMRSFDKLVSIDPSTCIIRNDTVLGDKFAWNNSMAPFFTPNNKNAGVINNIYLNFNLVENIFKSNISKTTGELSFYDFITSLLGKINYAFGNICDLELTINEEKCMTIIRDQNVPLRVDSKGSTLDSNSIPLQVYGYREGESNFVKNYSFKTQITNDLKNMLTIGATANSTIVNEDATIFEKWNQGLQDRFKVEGVDSKANSCNTNTDKVINPKRPSSGFLKDSLSKFEENTSNKSSLIDKVVKFFSLPEDIKKEQNRRLKEELKSYDKYLQYAFNELVTDFQGQNKMGSYYFLGLESFKVRGYNALKNTIKTSQKQHYAQTNSPSQNIGFIPIELSLEVDGISGIKIYNQLKIDTKFLPYNYPEVMEFVVMGVDHKLSENTWVTNIRAISKPKSTPPKLPVLQGPERSPFNPNF